MSKKAPYEVSGSSLVNLKAELYRKQAESKRKGDNGQGSVQQGYVAVRNNSLKSKGKSKLKNNPTVLPIQNEVRSEEQSEIERGWENAKIKLAEKAKRYDQMELSQYIPEEGEDEHLLVDFSRKVQNVKNFQQRESRRYSSDSDDDSDSETIGPVPLPRNIGEEWTEYEDYLGRSRKCLRKDLRSLLEHNAKLKAEMVDHSNASQPGATTQSAPEGPVESGFDFGGQAPLEERTLLSEDMRREVERRLWEQEELFGSSRAGVNEESDNSTKGKVPIHYQSVENNEIRNLGVGYFKFSKEEETRNEEIEELKRLHQQTLTQRSQNNQLKAKRKATSDARLAKVRERKILKGEPVADLPVEDDGNDEFEIALAEKAAQAVFMEDLKPAAKTGPAEMRPWDKGKLDPNKQDLDQTYVSVRREERNFDFAPPSSYSNKSESSFTKKKLPTPNTAPFFSSQPHSSVYHQQQTNHSVSPPSTTKTAIQIAPADHVRRRPDFSVPLPNYPSTPSVQPWEYLQQESVKTPSVPAADPWNSMPSWKERMKDQDDGSEPKHLQSGDDKRPYAFAPPPAMYSEVSGSKAMQFGRASEDEIREEAFKFFSKAKKNL